ncbi:multisubstrate pseudouridine synthase 7 [Coemansia javaensis]|uniref:Multisubstrate pseudouridine synthase 7 n=1 Tax=Coemansia javaensis TaxID=2761396 RepID=A0A9W8LGV5_9FUNG|nr:multisubstrate pseudouridine synthase 7 [Coemansia javaensis]
MAGTPEQDGERPAKRARGDNNASTSSNGEADGGGGSFLREADVGITQYITATSGWPGFDAIIKHRFSDFLVNEIDQQGNVVRLTSYTDADDPDPGPTAAEQEAAALNVPADAGEAFEQAFVRLAAVLGAEDAARIRAHLEQDDGGQPATLEQRALVLDRELTKDQRRDVYTTTNNFLPTQVTCETVGGRLKFIRRTQEQQQQKQDRQDRQDRQQQRGRGRGGQDGRAAAWRHAGDYCYFVMQKENHDSMEMLHQIARGLRASPRSFGMAGTKDKRGITVQRCSAFRIDHRRLIGLSRKLRGARLGNYSYGASELRLGDLGGNQFQIVLRRVRGADSATLAPVLAGIRATGFINYYGMQRFGTQGISSHAVGVAVLKADWAAAVDLILRPRAGDRKDVARARAVWAETRDARAALAALPQRAALAEHSVLQFFAGGGAAANCAGAFAAVPRNLRLMYVHAYQSYVWNAAASERVRRYGCAGPVPGDLVVPAEGFAATTRRPEPPPSGDGDGGDEPAYVTPTLVTAENAAQYTLYDVVLPLPGWGVTYPEHDVRAVYVDVMKRDGLSPFALGRHPLKEYKLAGAYRHLVIRPRDFEHEWIRYDDDAVPLVRSDSDAIEGRPPPAAAAAADGAHLALKLCFDLPPSAYATMLLRELMRQETASGHHTGLSARAAA